MISSYVYLRTKLFEALEQRAVQKSFYSHSYFEKLDGLLCAAYADRSPYQISKEYMLHKGREEIHVYGETPLTTLDAIVRAFGITSKDRIIEMGAGRGRVALFLAEYVGARVRAYEQIPHFVEIFQETISSKRLDIFQEDMFAADFSWASVIYLFGTMLGEQEIVALINRFPKETKILTVSYPLNDYSKEYRVVDTLLGRFPWGKTTIYCNERVDFLRN